MRAYLVRVVQVHDPTPVRRYILMALRLSAHDQRRIHVHVMTGKVQADQTLEDGGVGWFGGREED